MATPEPYKDSYLDDVRPAPGYFDQFRTGNFPTLYPSIKTSQSSDILISGFIYAAVILAFSLLLIVPGVRRWHVSTTAVLTLHLQRTVSVWLEDSPLPAGLLPSSKGTRLINAWSRSHDPF